MPLNKENTESSLKPIALNLKVPFISSIKIYISVEEVKLNQ